MTKKELVAGFFIEGDVHHNYDFLLENISEHYYDHSPAAAHSNQGCVDLHIKELLGKRQL